jgi:adenylyltransferase/sulfurtransferase
MKRYNRQIKLGNIGKGGQQKLLDAKVLVVGAGGLGAAILPYLTSAGIGKIGIIDGDVIEESNLQRQVIYSEDGVGKSKVQQAELRLSKLNSKVEVRTYNTFLKPSNALRLFEQYDIIVDATDSVEVRYLINDACIVSGKPFVYGSVFQFEGQVSVFNYKNGPTYRCLFGKENGRVPNCEESGVLGTTVGLIGMLQANEVMKMILGIGEALSGKLLIYNTLLNDQHIFKFKKNKAISVDEPSFNDTYHSEKNSEIKAEEALFQPGVWLDVRAVHEIPKLKLPNSINIPLPLLEENLHRLNKNEPIFIYCQAGKRSLQALKILQKQGFRNIKSVIGGAMALNKCIGNKRAGGKQLSADIIMHAIPDFCRSF